MNYLYHMVPERMEGRYLLPLNQLKTTHPGIYRRGASKYKGRKDLLRTEIKPLGCLWNDVIHLTTVHPSKIKRALLRTGNKLPRRKYFKINPLALDRNLATIWLYKPKTAPSGALQHFVPFDPNVLPKYNEVSKATEDYYKAMFKEGKRPLTYVFVPHVFYKGEIDVSESEIIVV